MKLHKPEKIVMKPRRVDVLILQGSGIADAIHQIEVSKFAFYRWGREFGGLKPGKIKRLKALEGRNTRLRRAIANALRGNFKRSEYGNGHDLVCRRTVPGNLGSARRWLTVLSSVNVIQRA